MTTQERNKRKLLTGKVISNKMNKTVVVAVEQTLRHPQFQKIVVRHKKYYAHSEIENLAEGDAVTIMETRPLSKLKRWRVVEKKV